MEQDAEPITAPPAARDDFSYPVTSPRSTLRSGIAASEARRPARGRRSQRRRQRWRSTLLMVTAALLAMIVGAAAARYTADRQQSAASDGARGQAAVPEAARSPEGTAGASAPADVPAGRTAMKTETAPGARSEPQPAPAPATTAPASAATTPAPATTTPAPATATPAPATTTAHAPTSEPAAAGAAEPHTPSDTQPVEAQSPGSPPTPDWRLSRAQALMDDGYVTYPPEDNAVAYLKRVLADDPNDARALTMLQQCSSRLIKTAVQAHDSGLDYQARNTLEEVLAFDPDNQQARHLWQQWVGASG